MTRDDVKEVFKSIKLVFDNFVISSEKVDFWYELLKDQKTEEVMKRLEYHLQTKSFPPSIADLRKQVIGRDIPDTYVHDLSAGEDWN